MGLFDRVFRPSKYNAEVLETAIKAANEDNAATLERALSGMLGFRSTGAPPGRRQLVQMYRDNSKLRRVVARIADDVAKNPILGGFVQDKAGRATMHKVHLARSFEQRAKWLRKTEEEGNFIDVPDHPLVHLLDRGNSVMTGFDIKKLTTIYLDVPGEAFWLLVRNQAGMPVEVWPIPPHWVTGTPSVDKPWYDVSFDPRQLPAQNVLWFRELDPDNPYGRGAGLGLSLGDELDTDEYAAKLTKATFLNRAVPYGVVSIKGAGKDAIGRLQEEWEQRHRGFRKHGLMKFTNGEVSFKRVDQSFQELELTDLRKAMAEEVQQTYGVPPEVVGDVENSNRASITSAALFMAEYVTIPRLERMLRTIVHQLVPQFDERLVLYYESPVPEDKAAQFEAAKTAPHNLTRNEWRTKFMGLDSVPDGDVYFVPVALIPERADREEEQPTEQPIIEPEEEEEGEPEEQRALRAVPKCGCVMVKQEGPELEAIQAVLDALQPETLTAELGPVWEEYAEDLGKGVLEDLGIEQRFDILNPLVREEVFAKTNERIADLVNPETQQALEQSLLEGFREGEGIAELRARVTGIFQEGQLDIYKVRANRIARTEVNRAANAATWSAHKQSGVVEARQWAASFVNTRETHVELNDTKPVGIDEPFEIPSTGDTAMYPGGFGIPEEDINCLCNTVAVITEPKSAEQLDAINRGFQREIIPWTRSAKQALIVGFENQKADALDVFDRVMPAAVQAA